MTDELVPDVSAGRLEVVRLPARLGEPNAGPVGDQLLAAVGSGAAMVILDMSDLLSWDRAGAGAVVLGYQKAAVTNTELRLVAGTRAARDLISAEGLDRLVPVYQSLRAAMAEATAEVPEPRQVSASPARPDLAAQQAHVGGGHVPAAVGDLVLRQLIDTLGDGIALTDEGGTIVLASRRLAEMFGYEQGELTGRGVDILVPVGLRRAHRQDRAAFLLHPISRPMSDRPRLAGLRKDGATLPVSITLSPVPTATGHFTLAVVRDTSRSRRGDDLTNLVLAAAAQARQDQEMLDRVVRSLFHVGLSLQAALDQPAEIARERITDALRRLDDTIHQVRDQVFGPIEPANPADRLDDPPTS